jgi:hypothetical protein
LCCPVELQELGFPVSSIKGKQRSELLRKKKQIRKNTTSYEVVQGSPLASFFLFIY